MRRLVVLDLNGVLLDSTHKPRPGVKHDAMARKKYVYFRPGLREFLAWLFAQDVHVAVWTSNIPANAHALVDLVFLPEQKRRLAFIFTRNECITFPDYSSVKPVERVFARGFSPDTLLLLDDSPGKVVHPLRHLFYRQVPSFQAGQEQGQDGFEVMKRYIAADNPDDEIHKQSE